MLPAKTGIIYFISLYFSVIIAKANVLNISEDIITIVKIKSERIFLPIKNNDGKRKNISIYQVGVSIKKHDLITLATTDAASIEAKNNPMENKNKNRCPIVLDKPLVKIILIS